jgi:hypothetical protein
VLGARFAATRGNAGRIVDAIVDRSGTVRAAIIDSGGFLGVAPENRGHWNALHFGRVANRRQHARSES